MSRTERCSEELRALDDTATGGFLFVVLVSRVLLVRFVCEGGEIIGEVFVKSGLVCVAAGDRIGS